MRLDDDILSPEQVEWLSLGLFIALIPISIYMYLHYRSLRRRFPGTPLGVPGPGQGAAGKAKTS